MILSDKLKQDYEALWKSQKFDKSIMEREKYDDFSYNAKKRVKLINFDPNVVPYLEINNRLDDESSILFVGLNPSGADIEHYYNNNKSVSSEVFIYNGSSSYYNEMRRFTYECLKELKGWKDEEWKEKEYTVAEGCYSELDLFGIVQSTQEIVQKDFLKPSNNFQSYIKMFDLFLEYAARIKPKVVVVANAFVRKLLLRDKNLKLDNAKYNAFYSNKGNSKFEIGKNAVNDEFGGYTFTITNEKESFGTQLFFSSMLSGQRALDLGSRENLVWLVRNYLKNNP